MVGTKHHALVRIAPWLLLAVAAYALGRWHGMSAPGSAEGSAETATPPGTARPAESAAAGHAPPGAEGAVIAEVDALVAAARTMSEPDARTYAFFEELELDLLPTVADRIAALPSSNEQDAMFLLAIRRWAQLDGPGALARADAIPNLALRAAARDEAFHGWAVHDSQAAFARAVAETGDTIRNRALGAVLTGAATTNPGAAVTLWEATPAEFRESPVGMTALQQIVDAAYGTGKREAIEAIIQGLSHGEERLILIDALARNAGMHRPRETLAWIQSALPAGDARNKIVDGMFAAYARKDPARAAEWAVEESDEARRASYVGAAIAQWAQLDTRAAEIWLNEQPEGEYLDFASYEMARLFLEQRKMTRAFAWTRRINSGEARAELLGNLGQIWSLERPEEFKKFLDETSLNRIERELLLSRIVAQQPPA